MTDSPFLLEVRDLSLSFETRRGTVQALDRINLMIRHGETVCLVGESGSGKSVTGRSIVRLINPPGHISCEHLSFDGVDLMALSEAEMCAVRGAQISVIFQEPLTALDPIFTVGAQVAEGIKLHERLSTHAAKARAVELLRMVGIPDPERRAEAYPHQLSGGMCQRVVIAMALACKPKMIIADEPTTAVDVSVQTQLLTLFREMKEQEDMAMLFITHDFGVVAEIADRVAVMYAGQIVEEGTIERIFSSPAHPYTEALLKCVPDINRDTPKNAKMPVIPGVVPDLIGRAEGCWFKKRCDRRHDRCDAAPPTIGMEAGHSVRCWLHA